MSSSSSSSISKDLCDRLGDEVASNSKLLEECLSICRIYNLTPEQLQFKWEAATFSSTPARAHEAARFTMDSLAGVKAQIKREMTQNTATRVQPRVSGAAAVNRARLPQFMNRNMAMKAGIGGGGEVQVKTEPGSGGFESSSIAGPSRAGSKVIFKGPKMDPSSRKERGYRYMYEKLNERSQVLDERIDEVAELVRNHYNIKDLGDPSSTTDEEIVVVGRITHDTETTVKLTEASLTLESSRMLCGGVRVPLRFEPSLKIRGGAQGAGAATIFPGAIVALKGKNGSGDNQSRRQLPPLKSAPNSSSPPAKPDPGVVDSPFSMTIGCGPYTPDNDLKYAPWRSLLGILKQSKPAVVLLTGPFVDSTHPLIAEGDVDEPPLALFNRIFLEPLRQFLESSPGTIAVLIPNVKDLISSHAVYPQCEMGPEVTKHDSRIHLVPNPTRFSINGVSFGATSVDTLFHLRKEEVTKRGEEVESIPPQTPEDTGADSMGNLCRHLLQQRSFYPVFPVPSELSGEINLDVTHSAGLKLDVDAEEYAPDVLIFPSKFKQFSKRVNSTLFINPSSVSKGVYGTLELAATAPGASLSARLKAEVVKKLRLDDDYLISTEIPLLRRYAEQLLSKPTSPDIKASSQLKRPPGGSPAEVGSESKR
ncbi:DNA-directed DNA polymerase alpha subunit pol12 [Marasmius sp. AFHP31]|nr:DNA-directed DNA polymerase alpha subunit pol12 [Marasmius sp. AFHP31]